MLLTASQVRHIVEESIARKSEEELNKIDEIITKAMHKNQFYCEIDYWISEYSKTKLEEKEYNVQYLGDGFVRFTRIEW